MNGLQREKTKGELVEMIKHHQEELTRIFEKIDNFLVKIKRDAESALECLDKGDIKGAQDYLSMILGVKK